MRMEEDRDLDPLIDPGRLLRAATRRAEVRTAARVDARLLAAPRDADAESVAVGIANVCVAVGWVRRARWGAIPIAVELSRAPNGEDPEIDPYSGPDSELFHDW